MLDATRSVLAATTINIDSEFDFLPIHSLCNKAVLEGEKGSHYEFLLKTVLNQDQDSQSIATKEFIWKLLTVMRETWAAKSSLVDSGNSRTSWASQKAADLIIEASSNLYIRLLGEGHIDTLIECCHQGLPTISEMGSRIGRRRLIEAVIQGLKRNSQAENFTRENFGNSAILGFRALRGPELVPILISLIDQSQFQSGSQVDRVFLVNTLLPICQKGCLGSKLHQSVTELLFNLQADFVNSSHAPSISNTSPNPSTYISDLLLNLNPSSSLLKPRTASTLSRFLPSLDPQTLTLITSSLLTKYHSSQTLSADQIIAAFLQQTLLEVFRDKSKLEQFSGESTWITQTSQNVQTVLEQRLDRRALGECDKQRALLAVRVWREWIRHTESYYCDKLQDSQDGMLVDSAKLDELEMAPVDWYMDPAVNHVQQATGSVSGDGLGSRQGKNQGAGFGESPSSTETIGAAIEEEDDFAPLFDTVSPTAAGAPNRLHHLYECLLCLRSQDPQKTRQALESLPSCLLTQLGAVESLAGELISALLPLEHSALKSQCVIILLLIAPQQIGKWVWQRIFFGDIGLGQKYEALLLVERALYESHRTEKAQGLVQAVLKKLGDEHSEESPLTLIEAPSHVLKTKKLLIQELDEDYPHSLPVTRPKIIGEDDLRADQIAQVKEEKIESQSKRWGYANKSFMSKQKDRIASTLLQKSFEERILEQVKPLYAEIFGEFFHLCK